MTDDPLSLLAAGASDLGELAVEGSLRPRTLDEYIGQEKIRGQLGIFIEAARQRGLAEMTGFVLAENQPMLRLASRLGFEVARDPDDHAVRVCRLALGDGA